MTTNPTRRRLRNRLFLLGLLPLVIALLFAGKVGLMLSAQAAGEDAYGSDKFGKAAREFAGNAKLNFMEAWLSPFNEGVAEHKDEDYRAALDLYADALRDVPDDEECTVRINMALAHEAIGNAALDGSAEGDDPKGSEAALEEFERGIDVLAEGDCPTDAPQGEEQTEDAKAVDERLRQKAEEQKQQQQQQNQNKKKQKQEQKSEKEKKELEKKQKKLQKRNAQGRQERAERKDYNDYPYTDSQDEPHW